MEIHQLRLFREVVDAGSISEAARRLNLSQPPVSYHIKMLEQELQVTLFQRGRRSIELTEAGRLLLRVTGTGAGISDEVLERIEEFRKTRTICPSLGIGIQNAIDRVELLYGGSGSVALRRQETGGTAVEIALPIVTVHSQIGEIGKLPQAQEKKGVGNA